MLISVIIPVYNRPDELSHLLKSMSRQDQKPDEVIIVEDGSAVLADEVCSKFKEELNLKYISQENTGPALARNNGAEQASGDWLLFLDSDCELPDDFFSRVKSRIAAQPETALFGGPDRDHASFTPVQKAINYAMTSVFTTGGIRGGSERSDRFYPRSFNMGVRKDVFQETGGFRDMRFGEDLDLSMRIISKGYKSALFQDCWVYHRRRTSFRAFFKQVFNSGVARIHLNQLHPGTLKPVHALPSLFTVGFIFALVAAVYSGIILLPFFLIALIWFIHSTAGSGSVLVGGLSVIASFIQLSGYGTGFIKAGFDIHIRGRETVQHAFKDGFYDS